MLWKRRLSVECSSSKIPRFFALSDLIGRREKFRVSCANARKIDIFATGKTLSKEPGKERWDMGNVWIEVEVG